MEEQIITVHKEQVFRYWEGDEKIEAAMSDKTFVYLDDKYHFLVPVKDIEMAEENRCKVRVLSEEGLDGIVQVTAKLQPGEYDNMLLPLQEVCDRACTFRDKIESIIADMNTFGYEIKDSIVPIDTMWTLKEGMEFWDVPLELNRLQHRTWEEVSELVKEAQAVQRYKEKLHGNLPELQNALIDKLFKCLPISQEEWKSVTGKAFDSRFFLDSIMEQWNRCNTEQGKYLVNTSDYRIEFGLEKHYWSGERVSCEELKRDMENWKEEKEQERGTLLVRKRGKCL